MFKKIFCSAIVCLCILSFCSCANKNESVSYSDGYGKSYNVLLDENGFIKKDETGKLFTVEIDEKGKAVLDGDGNMKTVLVDCPRIMTNGDRVECSDFAITIPEGWELTGEEMIKLIHESTGSEISFSLRSTDTKDECVKQVKELYEDWEPKWEESDIKLEFADAKLLKSSNLLVNTEKSFYIFTHNENSYIVQATVYGGKSEGVNFEELINSICFR